MYNKIFLLKFYFLDASLASNINNTQNSTLNISNSNKCEDDICISLNKDCNNIKQCNKNDKIDLPLFDNTHSNDNKNLAFLSKNVPTLSSDGNSNKANNNKIANDNNMINGKSLICLYCIYNIYVLCSYVRHLKLYLFFYKLVN